MAYSGSSRFLLCFGLFVVSCSFCSCANFMRLKALRKFQGQTKGSLLHHGRLLIGQSSLQGATPKRPEAAEVVLDVDSDYQADMVWEKPKQPTVLGNDYSRLNPDSRAVEQLLKLEPEVECTGNFMQLQVRNTASTPGSLFLVDRGSHLSPLPLSKLPPSCGFKFRPTQRHLVLVAPYDGCFVALEGDSYVLPLRWFGLAVRMSCPLRRPSSPNPPMVTCHTEGMIVKTEWTVPIAKINVKLNGSWEPLMKASSSCGFSVVVHPEGVVISVHYAPCLEEKDGMFTLELTGDGESKISCPSLSASHHEPTESSHPQPEDHSQNSNPQVSAVPGLPQFPGASGKPHDVVAPAVIKPQFPYYPFPFYVPLPQHGTLSTQPPVTEPPVKHPAVQPADQEPHPSSPFVFYNPPSVDQAYFNEPHREHFFYQDPFHHGFSDSDHYPLPMPLKQETMALSPHSQSSPHLETPQAPSALVQQLEQVTTASSNGNNPQSVFQQPSGGGAVPPDYAWLSAVHCPRVCPSGFSNCCPQMAFHQYLHLVPTGFGRKPTGFGSSLGSAPHHPNEPLTVQAHSSSTSTPISQQSNAPGNGHEHLQPADGIHAAHARRRAGEPTNLQQQSNFYDLPQAGPFYPVPYNVPSRPWAQGHNSLNQMVQFEPYSVNGPQQQNVQQSPRNAHNPPGHHLMYTFGQYQQQRQNKPAAWQLQSSHSQSRESPDLDAFHVPDSTVQEAQTPTYKTPLVPNSSQPARDQAAHSSEPESNVLLHHGPPGWTGHQLPFKKLVHDPNFVPQTRGHNFPWEQYQRVSGDR